MCTEVKSGAKCVTRRQERGWVRISSTCSPCTCCPGADGLQSPVGVLCGADIGPVLFHVFINGPGCRT